MVMNPANQRLTPIQTRYKGQKWRCGQCGIDHVGGCEKLKEFYAAEDLRKKDVIDMKLLSDSTLRHAEQVGLRADVLCMSGAGIGHLANALRDDPDIAGCGAVGVVLGGNDFTNSEAASDAEFVYTIDKGVGRLKEELDKYGSKTLVVFSPSPGPNADPLTVHRAQYMCDALESIRGENISTPHVLPPEVARDDGGHPTVEGTKTLLQYVKDEVKPDLVFREDLMVTERLYVGVQSVYCYGCRTCGRVGQFPGKVGICPTCQDGVGQYDGEERWTSFVASLPPPPLPPPALPPLINPNNWRSVDVGGVVDKRPRGDDSGEEEENSTKVHVTEASPQHQNEIDSLDEN